MKAVIAYDLVADKYDFHFTSDINLSKSISMWDSVFRLVVIMGNGF